jgi:hypothetical protein
MEERRRISRGTSSYGFPALIPWFSTGSMVSPIPSFITYQGKTLIQSPVQVILVCTF